MFVHLAAIESVYRVKYKNFQISAEVLEPKTLG